MRPSSEAKRAAIVEAAARVFFEAGYEAASIEAIAAAAGVSKVTVYNHFGGKEALFKASVQAECARMEAAMAIDPAGLRRPIEEHLRLLGESFLAFTARPEMMRFDRRIAAEADRDPAIGTAFLDAGPRPMKAHMAALIAAAVEAGELEVEDPDLAAEQFVSMAKGFGEMERRYCGRSDPARDAERIEGAIRTFMRAYGKRA
ncbi:TetR/AcrR family transcriptional regulator [Sphingomicrobium aestuariivivum]|uniref:TetR/AcrR family transcriptional regulator n=1 Tax=Sphingomicrobium aestuariivivum TaxID=1582356 RepID=UPI001FD711C0|nr:TetR/AcrR family transcriptional regulator [Sphingomicrobium aestuariivivum]MCJ8191422.1 TetR/AcrR family transcriptional regulator [Sphingomicrobium aestuariivivum]